MSRSQLLPGKTTTPTRTAIRRAPPPIDDAPADRLDRVRLDERVREQLGRQALDDRARGGLVGGLDRQLHAATDADGADALDPEVPQAALHGPPLRVEDAGLGGDVDGEAVAAHRAITSSWR